MTFLHFSEWKGGESPKQKSITLTPKNVSLVSKSITDVTSSKKESLNDYFRLFEIGLKSYYDYL